MKTITHYKNINHFETSRLIARQLTTDDLHFIQIMDQNQEIMKTLGGIRPPKETLQYFKENIEKWKKDGFGLWLWFDKSTHDFIGRGGLRTVDVSGNTEVEIAYAIMPIFWQQGFATEITKACIEIAFEVLRLPNLVCFTLTTNQPSQSVMQKAGFQYEKDIIHADLAHVFYRMKNYRQVVLFDYDKKWPTLFEQEAKRLQSNLSHMIAEIHHIGSTSIPNMPAKPIIDVLLECHHLGCVSDLKKSLSQLGYAFIRRHIIPHYSYYTSRQENTLSYSIQILECGDPQIKRHVNFRDYLIAHPDDATSYANLKRKLANKHSDNIYSYVFGKTKFVQTIDTKAKTWPNRRKDFHTISLGQDFSKWTENQIIKAMTANLNVHLTHFAQYIHPVELIRIPGYTIVNAGLQDDTFNFVLDADFSESNANQSILEITHYFKKKHVPFSWWVSPQDKPTNLDKYLVKHHYQNTENNQAMIFDLDSWDGKIDLPSELTIKRAMDEKTLRDFALVLANDYDAFKTYYSWISEILTDDDPFAFYVGYVNDKPVTRGLCCYYAGIAGLHWLSTTRNQRRKGYARAMQQYRLKEAKQLGFHVAVLQASEEGYPLYKKLGYKECGTFKEFKLV